MANEVLHIADWWNKDDQEQSGDKLSISMQQNASKMFGELTALTALDAITIADEWCDLVV